MVRIYQYLFSKITKLLFKRCFKLIHIEFTIKPNISKICFIIQKLTNLMTIKQKFQYHFKYGHILKQLINIDANVLLQKPINYIYFKHGINNFLTRVYSWKATFGNIF